MEIWKRIKINDKETNYEISNHGRCRNIQKIHWKTLGLLTPKHNKQNGYLQYCITVNKIKYYKYAHRLVAECFVDGDKTLHVNHKDGVKTNNHYTNLEWVTAFENMRHCFDNGLSSVNHPVEQYDLKGNYINTYNSGSEAERETGIDTRSINCAVLGKVTHSGGYQWKRVNDPKEIKDITNIYKRMNETLIQLTLDGKFVQEFEKMTHAYDYLNKTDNGTISQVCKGRQKTAYGFKWMYANDYYNREKNELIQKVK